MDLIAYQNGKEVLRYMRGCADLAGTTMKKIAESIGTYDLTY